MRHWFQLILALIFLGVGPAFCWKLTLLHVNDILSTITPVSEGGVDASQGNVGICQVDDEERSKQSFGGMTRLYRAVEKFRKETDVLFLNGGDFFHGTWYQLFKWKVLRFDAMALGNHEFDDGLGDLELFLNALNGTDAVAANLIIKDSSSGLNNLIRNYTIVEKNGHKIGIIGFMAKNLHKESRFLRCDTLIEDEIEVMTKQANILHKSGEVDAIIALGHSKKFENLKEIARKVPHISLVVGGGPKTFLSNQDTQNGIFEGNYPIKIENQHNQSVLIVTAYPKTKYLGYLELQFNNSVLEKWNGSLILLNKTEVEILPLVKEYKVNSTAQNEKPIIYSDNYFKESYNEETALGNIITDAMVWAVSNQSQERHKKIELSILNSGTIRKSLNCGKVTKRDIVSILPYGNSIEIININGSELRTVFENSVEKFTEDGRNDDRNFLQVSGFRLKYDLQNDASKRLIFAEVKENGEYTEINDKATYEVVINSYMKTLPIFEDKNGDLCNNTTQNNITQLKATIQYLAYLNVTGNLTLRKEKRIYFVPDCMVKTKKELPTIVLLGPSGVGKSTLRRKLMPNRKYPPISEKKGYGNKTMNYYIGNWLGTEECFAIIDTPGRCEEWQKKSEYWIKMVRKDFKTINAFLFILDGRKQQKLGKETIQLINTYKRRFGERVLSQTVFNINWWKHNECSIEQRQYIDFQENDMTKMIQNEIANLGWKNGGKVTTLFIDPMFEYIFLKTEDNTEANQFKKYTAKLWEFVQSSTNISEKYRYSSHMNLLKEREIKNICEKDKAECNEEAYFVCDNDEYCINPKLLNNGMNDCNDNSDEPITENDIGNDTVQVRRELVLKDQRLSLSVSIAVQLTVKEKKGVKNSCFDELDVLTKDKKFYNIIIDMETQNEILNKTENEAHFKKELPLQFLGKKVNVSIWGYSKAMERANSTYINLANFGNSFGGTIIDGNIDFGEWDCNEDNKTRVAIKLSQTCTDITLRERCQPWKEGDVSMKEVLSYFCQGFQEEAYITLVGIIYLLILLCLFVILNMTSQCTECHSLENEGTSPQEISDTHTPHLDTTFMDSLSFKLFLAKTFQEKENTFKSFYEVENKHHETSESHFQCIYGNIKDENFAKGYLNYVKRRHHNTNNTLEKQQNIKCFGYEIIYTLNKLQKKEKPDFLIMSTSKKIIYLMTSASFWNKFLFICMYVWDYVKDFSFIDALNHYNNNIATGSITGDDYFNTSYPFYVCIFILVQTQIITMIYIGLKMNSQSRSSILGNCCHYPLWKRIGRRLPLFLPAAAPFLYFLEYCRQTMQQEKLRKSPDSERKYQKYLTLKTNQNQNMGCFYGTELIEKICETFPQFYLNIAILIKIPTLVLTFSFGIPFEVLVACFSMLSIFSLTSTFKNYKNGSESIYISSTSVYSICKTISIFLAIVTKFLIYLICLYPFPTLFGISMFIQGIITFIIFSYTNLFPTFKQAPAHNKMLHILFSCIIPSPIPPRSNNLEKNTNTQMVTCSALFFMECFLNIIFALCSYSLHSANLMNESSIQLAKYTAYHQMYDKIATYLGLDQDFLLLLGILLVLLTASVCLSLTLEWTALHYYHPSRKLSENFQNSCNISPPAADIGTISLRWMANTRKSTNVLLKTKLESTQSRDGKKDSNDDLNGRNREMEMDSIENRK